jgi:parallel beta-helix repeat protein
VAGLAFVVFLLTSGLPTRIPSGAIVIPRDVPTLEEALARAESGAIILLDAERLGDVGPVSIDVEGITLGSWKGRARLRGSGIEPALSVQADGVTIRDLDISADHIGVLLTGSGGRLENVDVRDAPVGVQLSGVRGFTLEEVRISGAQIGLELVSSGGNVLRAVTVDGAAEVGVKILASLGNTLERFVVTHSPVGVSLTQGSTDNRLVDGRVATCESAGVEVRRSIDNLLIHVEVTDAHVGIIFDRVSGCVVDQCRVERTSATGILLQQSVKNRLTENVIASCAGDGMLLQQSSENTLAYNEVRGTVGAGIRMDDGGRNLVTGNDLEGGGGIQVRGASSCRILRNEVSAGTVGILLEGGADHQVFDNRLLASGFGVALVGATGTTVLRTEIRYATEAGLVVMNGANANSIVQNRFESSGIGLFVDGAARSEIRENEIVRNGVGISIVRPGPTLRIEGNDIQGNGVGLRQSDPSDVPDLRYDWLGVTPSTEEGDGAAPVLANNTFSGNTRWDIRNEAESALHAGGNWWGQALPSRDPAGAVVLGNVLLQQSAWKGTIAIATQNGNLAILLGRILQEALIGAGYRVIDLIGMEDVRLVRDAILAKDADLMWWDADAAGDSVAAPDGEAGVEAFGIPARRGWVAVVSASVADGLSEKTLEALALGLRASGETLRWAAPLAFGEEALAVFEGAYGFGESVSDVDWTKNLEETEALLKFGVADLAIVDSLEETVTLSGFVPLSDGRGALTSTEIAALVRSDLVGEESEARFVLTQLQSRLTGDSLHDLISRVRLLHREPDVVAREFLKREGLLDE